MSSHPGELQLTDVPVPIQHDDGTDYLLIDVPVPIQQDDDVPVPIQQDDDDDKDDLLLSRTKKWIKEMRGRLMPLATILASLAYLSALYPPGGFWREDKAGPYPYGHGASTTGPSLLIFVFPCTVIAWGFLLLIIPGIGQVIWMLLRFLRRLFML